MTNIYTYWYRWNKKHRQMEYNHRSVGYIKSRDPTPISKLQKLSWKNAKWTKQIYK